MRRWYPPEYVHFIAVGLLAADNLVGMQELTAEGIVPVVADESLASVEDARRLVELSACNIFNIRVSKMGGLLNAARVHRIGREAGLNYLYFGNFLESGKQDTFCPNCNRTLIRRHGFKLLVNAQYSNSHQLAFFLIISNSNW